MAIDKKTLQMLLNNPGMFNAEELDLEDTGESLAPDESSDGSMDIPEIDPESDMDSPDIADPDEIDQSNDLSKDMDVASADSDIVAKLKRLKAGEPMDQMDEQEDESVASDMSAPMDLRKKALQKIKQKYLGQ